MPTTVFVNPKPTQAVSKTAHQKVLEAAGVPQDRNERTDATVAKLKLAGALKKGGIDIDITRVLTDATPLEDTMAGPPSLTISLLDRDYRALNSGVFGDAVDIDLDGVPFRLVKVSIKAPEQLELLFEHKLVALLRQHTTPIKANRSTTTRAQFIERMLEEITGDMPGIVYICPEINKVQPVGATKATGRTLKTKTLGATPVVSQAVQTPTTGLSSLSIRDWSGATVTLGPSQMANAATVLQVCAQLNAGPKATLAMMEACSVEPDVPYGNPPVQSGSGGSAGILQWGGGGQALPSWAQDVAQAVAHSLQDPGATSKGGMISLARNNPGWSAGQVAQAEQGSAFPARYDSAGPGAQAVIDAFTRAGGFAGAGITGAGASTTGQYEFTRGQSGSPEDSWTCGQRLASEVNWRLFVVGRKTVYFVTDDDLMDNPTKYKFGPNTPGIDHIELDAEVGGRTIVLKGKRQPKPSEAIVFCRIDRWDAPPGNVVEIEGYGVGDGPWLVFDVQRSLFDPAGQITLHTPQKPLPEPAAPAATPASTAAGGVVTPAGAASLSSANPIDRVYAAASMMDAMNLPYFIGSRQITDPPPRSGYDCSASVAWALWKAGIYGGPTGWAWVSGEFASSWGAAGVGTQMTVWATGGHVFIEFYGRPAKRFDTVPGGGPHLRYVGPTSYESSGFTPKHWPGF